MIVTILGMLSFVFLVSGVMLFLLDKKGFEGKGFLRKLSMVFFVLSGICFVLIFSIAVFIGVQKI
jgi:uncharacterized iron-regulated membrane protein